MWVEYFSGLAKSKVDEIEGLRELNHRVWSYWICLGKMRREFWILHLFSQDLSRICYSHDSTILIVIQQHNSNCDTAGRSDLAKE